MEGSGKMVVIAVGKLSQAGIIKSLASGQDQMKAWVSLDGSVNVVNGSNAVTYNPLKETLTKFVHHGAQVKINGVEYTIDKSVPVTKKGFNVERPYGKRIYDLKATFSYYCFTLTYNIIYIS